ncbi:AAA family ATPase [Streptomyces viridiviolaceus]|uniref:AAA family ATPase n=1 Tax=Streptomyces viridiviolaceus TaxID=68282 RepID=A0ABW2E1U4_9ACTN
MRPVFLRGAPGIGKSSPVRDFADSLGLECVSLLGTQLAPEDLIGVPRIRNGRSVFCPPEAIARDEPYCLFLDDFPSAAPVLVVTDGRCDVLRVRREHAYLIPQGARLPFTARGPVFRVS